MNLSSSQLRTLQTLFSLYARHSLDASGDLRAERLAWASQSVGHQVSSFSELSDSEAARLIDRLKETLGQEVTPPQRRPRNREAAMARGVHGRRNAVVKIEVLATREDVSEIDHLRERVGMTREGFGSWLVSRSSPIRGRKVLELRTVSDCNRVRWALKSMLRRAG